MKDESSFWKYWRGLAWSNISQAAKLLYFFLIFKHLPASSQCPFTACHVALWRLTKIWSFSLHLTKHLNIKKGLSPCFSLLILPTTLHCVTPTSPKNRYSLPSSPSPNENRICTAMIQEVCLWLCHKAHDCGFWQLRLGSSTVTVSPCPPHT